MIHTKQTYSKIVESINNDFIEDKFPLKQYAGFEDFSDFRKTFSLVISSDQLNIIKEELKPIYEKIVQSCKEKSLQPLRLPFDFVRIDAFVDPHNFKLHILEINSKNVGQHEFTEWMDQEITKVLDSNIDVSLNRYIIENQQILFNEFLKSYQKIFYLSDPQIPRWIYFNTIKEVFNLDVIDIPSYQDLYIEDDVIKYKGEIVQAVIRKFSKFPKDVRDKVKKELNEAQLTKKDFFFVQPYFSKHVGEKDFLTEIHNSNITESLIFDPSLVNEYIQHKDTLVLKISNSGNSKSIYLGGEYSVEEWKDLIDKALINPSNWIMQKFIDPYTSMLEIIPHQDLMPKTLPVLLGIFILPDQTNPDNFIIDLTVKAYTGSEKFFKYDPSSILKEIWFGNVIVQ